MNEYNRALSAAERLQVESYLAEKYSFFVDILVNKMKSILLFACLLLMQNPCFANESNELWVVVSRPAKGEIVYEIGGKKVQSLDAVATALREWRKRHFSFPAVRSIFEPSCRVEDFSNLRGWLGKLGVLDDKYFLTDSARRSIVEFGTVGHQLPFPP